MSEFKNIKAEFAMNAHPSLQERKAILLALKRALQNNADTVAEAINKDFTHRSVEESLF